MRETTSLLSGPELLYCSLPGERRVEIEDIPDLFLLSQSLYETQYSKDGLTITEINQHTTNKSHGSTGRGSNFLIIEGTKDTAISIPIGPKKGQKASKAAGMQPPQLSQEEMPSYINDVLNFLETHPHIFPAVSTRFYEALQYHGYEYNLDLSSGIAERADCVNIGRILVRKALGDNGVISRSELIDIYSNLKGKHGSFFAEIIKLRNTISQSATLAESPHLLAASDTLRRLEDIENELELNSFINNILSEYLGSPRPALELVGAFVVAEVTDAPVYASVSGIVALTIANVLHAIWKMKVKNEEVLRDPYTFLRSIYQFRELNGATREP